MRRFDTLFFVARRRTGDWQPQVIEGECTGAHWISAAEVLEREQSGEAAADLPHPAHARAARATSTFEEIRADATAHPIEPMTPWVEEVDGERFITIPDGIRLSR